MLSSTTATSFAPLKSLPNNTYYWRVRGVDPQRQAGPWNNGPAFDKTFDRTVLPGPANLRIRDSHLEVVANGANVNEPVATWNTVPGATRYEVQVLCAAGGTTETQVYSTTNTAWTPLAEHGTGIPALFNSANVGVETGGSPLAAGRNCGVLVRAFADSAVDGSAIYGDYAQSTTFLVGGQTIDTEPLVDCDDPAPFPSECLGRLDYDDIISTGPGSIIGKNPLLCWSPADMRSRRGQPGRQRRQHGLLGGDRT